MINRIKTRTPLLLLVLALATNAQAQTAGLSSNSKDPLEISADGSLEWLRNKKTFVATQNAVAVQGESSVAASKLTAMYRDNDGPNSKMEIYKVTADTNVVLKSRDSTAYGDEAVYDLDAGLAVMTGQALKMVSPDQTITARDKFEYYTEAGRVNAIGNAKVVRPKVGGGQDTLTADKLTAILKTNAQGEQVVDTLEAIGNVVITTPTETLTGAYGIYRSGSNTAEITGGVNIKRGPNTLEGDRATVDLTTNVSTIYGAPQNPLAPSDTGRVRGIFYPGSDN